MAKVKVVLNKSNVQTEILKSAAVGDYIEQLANEKARQCGAGYATSRFANGRNRLNVSVYAESEEAKRDNLNNNTLLKIVGV